MSRLVSFARTRSQPGGRVQNSRRRARTRATYRSTTFDSTPPAPHGDGQKLTIIRSRARSFRILSRFTSRRDSRHLRPNHPNRGGMPRAVRVQRSRHSDYARSGGETNAIKVRYRREGWKHERSHFVAKSIETFIYALMRRASRLKASKNPIDKN